MAESAQIAKLSDMHSAMVDWLIVNPTKSRREMAAHFQVTLPWLSTIIHSDVFQAELQRRQGQVFNNAIVRPLQERLLGAAHLALDRLEDCLQTGVQVEEMVKAVDMLTKATGNFRHAAGPPAGQQNNQFNTFVVSPEDLARARQMIGRVPLAMGVTHDDSGQVAGDRKILPAIGGGTLGEAYCPAALQSPESSKPSSPPGPQVRAEGARGAQP